MATGRPPAYRSILFVPGDRPDRFGKALATGADAVCIDLEDAVAPARKEDARGAVMRFLAEPRDHGPDVVVRLNDRASDEWPLDVAAVSDHPPDALMIPKVRSGRDVEEVAAAVGPGVRLLPLIETAEGLEHVTSIARAVPTVSALIFGGFDLALELGASPEWEPLLHARSRVVHAAALGRTRAIDMPSREVHDLDAVRAEAERARRLGFGGKAAIHPAQVPVIASVFAPSADEVAWARKVVAASEGSGEGAVMMEGAMVDRPIVEAARRILAVAGEQGAPWPAAALAPGSD